jgi:hypothetical protein
LCQLLDSGIAEKVAQRYPDTQITVDAADHLGGLQAVTAQGEKVVADADPLCTQDLSPDADKFGFDLIGRGQEFVLLCCGSGQGCQCSAVDLAIGR